MKLNDARLFVAEQHLLKQFREFAQHRRFHAHAGRASDALFYARLMRCMSDSIRSVRALRKLVEMFARMERGTR